MMEYKGYIGNVIYDDRSDILYGQVINIKDTVTFEAISVAELKKEFRASVDDYLAFCAERGEQPDKPYSGTLRLRLEPELHRRAATAAALAGKSLNSYIAESVERRVSAG
jgi:predicted HicB family RNase H-like nuclease